jgi:signal transduction histidine kinase
MRTLSQVIALQPKPIRWHEIEHRLREPGTDMVLLAILTGPERFYQSKGWPADLTPELISPKAILPIHYEQILGPPNRLPGPHDPQGKRPRKPADELPKVDVLPSQPRQPLDPLRHYAAFTDGETILLLGASRAPMEANLWRLVSHGLLAFPAILLLIAGVAYVGAERGLRQVEKLAESIQSLQASGLGHQLDPAATQQEFQRLTHVYNEMSERLQASFVQSRQFADNAAHELRTPLTILQGKLETAMRQDIPGSRSQVQLADMLEEVSRLKSILDQLLLFARSDGGKLDLYRESVDLAALLRSLLEDFQDLNPQLPFRISMPPSCFVDCDKGLVVQTLHNLLSNATKYNLREGGMVAVDLTIDAEWCVLLVSNTAKPIAPAQQLRIFDRFFRADQSRSRRIEGTGLGLSLAREIARAHGGDVVLVESTAEITRFRLTLPLQAPPR